MEHTKEPWKIKHGHNSDYPMQIVGHDESSITTFDSFAKPKSKTTQANARRIVACVNACAEMPQEDLEELAKVGVIELIVYADDMSQQRDELLAVLEAMLQEVDDYHWTTKAARAVIQKVRGGEC